MAETGLEKLQRMVAAEHGLCTFSCLLPSGAPHVSVINAGVMAHPLTGEQAVCAVIMGKSLKARLLRADARVAISFRHSWDWVAVRGTAQLIGLDDPADGFEMAHLPTLLRDVFKSAGGTHEDWDEYDRVMVEQRRVAVCVSIDRITSNAGSID